MTDVPEAASPKAVQSWSASDYAKNGRFVLELAGPVFAMLAPKPGERVLDVGCGEGTLTAEIKAVGDDVLGRGPRERAACAEDGRSYPRFRRGVRSGVLQRGAPLNARARARHCGRRARTGAEMPLRRRGGHGNAYTHRVLGPEALRHIVAPIFEDAF